MTTRPRLTPAIADVRRAVRASLVDSVVSFGIAPKAPPIEAHHAPAFGAIPDEQVSGNGPVCAEWVDALAHSGRTGPEFGGAFVLVALSGGADSLALAAATAFEAARAGVRAGAVIVDHGLQTGSADVAA
ncbi:MAG: hypothetical protein ABI400_12970, partial [Lacisediminihabitans sp.]